jgi:2-C-methyl-D-erythritol 4-phosphate cytidylyltransferase
VNKDKIAAIIVAAGKGIRMNHSLPKQYLPLEGKPILAHTLLNLAQIPEINTINLVVSKDRIQWCKEKIIKRYDIKKVRKIVGGGKTRSDSVLNGLKNLDSQTEIVAIHDGVRPFLEESTFRNLVNQAKKFGAAICAIPLRDTLKKVNKNEVKSTEDRDGLWLVQTPQVFRYSVILDAYKKAKRDDLKATDDAAIVERLPHPVKIVEGSPLNIKITTPQDLVLAEAIYEILYS